MPRAVAFYRDLLGLPLMVESDGSALFDGGSVRLMLLKFTSVPSQSSSAVIYFEVENIEAEHERLSASGVTFESEPHLLARLPAHELWIAPFRDPDQNRLALLCEKR